MEYYTNLSAQAENIFNNIAQLVKVPMPEELETFTIQVDNVSIYLMTYIGKINSTNITFRI